MIIWLADDREESRRIAFKEMRRAERDSLRFRHEFYAMRRLKHPGTVEVYDCGMLANGIRYITMEFAEGRDLSELPFTDAVLETRFDPPERTGAAASILGNPGAVNVIEKFGKSWYASLGSSLS